MDDDHEADPALAGFEEAMADFDRLTRVRLLDDATLVHRYHALSNAKVIRDSALLTLLSDEMQARGLLKEH